MSDSYFLLLIQFSLAFLLIYAIFRQWFGGRQEFNKQSGATASVKRGETSWSNLYIAYGIVSIVLIQIISISESFKGHKVGLSLVDIAALIYLFFYNGWFRNKMISFIHKSKQLKEKF